MKTAIKFVLAKFHLQWLGSYLYGFGLAQVCRIRYVRQLRRIRAKPKSDKVRVLFIVSEIAKWKEQLLFEEMERSGVFEPIVGLSAWNAQLEERVSNEQLLGVHKAAEDFFDRMGDRHVRTVNVVDGKRVVSDLSEFKPDIVFYTEPWLPCGKQGSRYVSSFSITCYVPYSTPIWGYKSDWKLPIHFYLNKMFVQNEFWRNYYRRARNRINHICDFVATGHPALDYFNASRGIEKHRDLVIYAPHFSFHHPKHSHLFQFISTFEQTGLPILRYAQEHPEIHWVFKPHPLLRDDLVFTGLMTKEEVDRYYKAWEDIGASCYDADYQDLFDRSRAMITDSGSFLMEYGATGMPLIQLVSAYDPGIKPEMSKRVVDSYYRVYNIIEMYKTFKIVLEEGKDPKREGRLRAVRGAGLMDQRASKNIVEYLRELLRR